MLVHVCGNVVIIVAERALEAGAAIAVVKFVRTRKSCPQEMLHKETSGKEVSIEISLK